MSPPRRPRLALRAIALAAVFGAVLTFCGSALAVRAEPLGGGDVRLTPVVASVVSTPRWFKGADNRFHLVYELELRNASAVPVTVTSVEIIERKRDRVIFTLAGDALTAATSLLASGDTPTTALPPSTIGIVWLDVAIEKRSRIPARIRHRITVSVPPGLPAPESITETSAPAKVDLRPPVVLAPPLVGPRWAAVGSCCDGPHRRSIQPLNGALYLGQRFAIDFNRLDPENRTNTGDPSVNESYPTYGQPVVAVADARVVVAVDRFPDQTPNAPGPVTLESVDGNHVILALGNGRYAFYAHLKPGSIAVRAGDRVRRGQQLALTGNSGNSTGPHLHFQVMDRPSALRADGLPYVFDRFDLTGLTPPLDVLLELDQAQEPVPIDTAGGGPRRNELPLGRDVVTFPEQ